MSTYNLAATYVCIGTASFVAPEMINIHCAKFSFGETSFILLFCKNKLEDYKNRKSTLKKACNII